MQCLTTAGTICSLFSCSFAAAAADGITAADATRKKAAIAPTCCCGTYCSPAAAAAETFAANKRHWGNPEIKKSFSSFSVNIGEELLLCGKILAYGVYACYTIVSAVLHDKPQQNVNTTFAGYSFAESRAGERQ